MIDCIFCKIIDGKIPSTKTYESDEFLAILDISQFTEGHTLVIPKKHCEFIWDIENAAGFIEFTNKIANHYRNDLNYKYVDSGSFGRMVPHAHLHLIPHNGEINDWRNALTEVGKMQQDIKRRKNAHELAILSDKFEICD